MQSDHTYDDQIIRQFTQFLRWSVTAELILGIAEVSMGWALASLSLSLVGGTTLIAAILFMLALWLLRRTRVLAAIATISVSCCILATLYMLAMPVLIPVSALFTIAAVGLPMLFSSRQLFGTMVILAVITTLILAALEFFPPVVPQASALVGHMVNLFSLPIIVTILSLLFSHISQNAQASLLSTQAANQELHLLKDQLEAQVEQRTADLRTALATVESQAATQGQLLAEVAQQREAIRELSVPV
ncbi:MAG: hypothetical protein HGB28_06520, partial [Oscillochloris sp.]|nr:hypothetical protein [Oscillochloris sp.]